MRCWGQNYAGQVGLGHTTSPAAASNDVDLGGQAAAQICAGAQHSCALLDNGDVYCWGDNTSGQLGYGHINAIGDNENVSSVGPVDVFSTSELAANRRVHSLHCGGRVTCIISDSNQLRCWGDNSEGQLGYGDLDDRGDDELPSTLGWVSLSGESARQATIGDYVTCALTDAGARCWGMTDRNSSGCLGHGGSCGTEVDTPPSGVIDTGSAPVQALGNRSESGTICAVLEDQGIKCWSGNPVNNCGISNTANPIDPPDSEYTLPPDVIQASLVLGQGDFDSATMATTQGGMNNPQDVAVDPGTGKVFVADMGNNRVLRFTSVDMLTDGALAEGVLGQPDFDTATGTTTQTGMKAPRGIFVDSSGSLWVSDSDNHRILRFDDAVNKTDGGSADAVLGQSIFTTAGAGTSQSELQNPSGLQVDSAGRLWVADAGNNRVLRFDDAANKSDGDPADGVLGQPDFDSNTADTSQVGLDQPIALVLGPSGSLWVADMGNHRVVRFEDAANKSDGDPADGVLGQPDFDTATSAAGDAGMANPAGVTIGTGEPQLVVSDRNNNRLLVFDLDTVPADGASAKTVVGQAGYSANSASTSQSGLWSPTNGFFDNTAGKAWVADSDNHRVVMYDAGGGGPGTNGYFVMSQDLPGGGNLGGMMGANMECLSQLMTHDWMGKGDAMARGLLDPMKVRAFLCDQNICMDGAPNAEYRFASMQNAANGGASMYTDGSGLGPGDSASWDDTSHFGDLGTGQNMRYFTGRAAGSDTTRWPSMNYGAGYTNCGDWSATTGGTAGGLPGHTNAMRWAQWSQSDSCSQTNHSIICWVHP